LSKYPPHITDEALVEAYKSTLDKQALGELFNRYNHLVSSVAYKYLQDIDAAKDACMSIFEKLVSILPNQNIVLFKAWIHTVTKNHCLMLLRKPNAPISLTDNILNYTVETEDNMHLAIQKEEQLNKMHRALAQLEEGQKKCISLFYLEKLSYTAIQQATGYTYMEVKSYIQNGKRNLKLKMEHNG
jgi:RNA polymerase sigma factor (sigma-70 family)